MLWPGHLWRDAPGRLEGVGLLSVPAVISREIIYSRNGEGKKMIWLERLAAESPKDNDVSWRIP